MKTATLGDPNIMQEPYTRFHIHYLDINRMDQVLKSNGINYFAMEMNRNQINWVLNISDEKIKKFYKMIVCYDFNLAPMNHLFWYQDRDRESMQPSGFLIHWRPVKTENGNIPRYNDCKYCNRSSVCK